MNDLLSRLATLNIAAGYEWTRAAFEKAALKAGRASRKLTTLEYIIAGAVAGSATVFMTNPIWVVNTRMTARQQTPDEQAPPGNRPKKAPSTIGTFLSLIRQEGVSSLFKGVLPALVLVINPILQYTIFEQLKALLAKRRRVTPTDVFCLGAVGKLLATSITYPYITIKSRMHVADKDGAREHMLHALRRTIRDEGWSSLYKGMVPCCSWHRDPDANHAQELAPNSRKACLPQLSYLLSKMSCMS